MSFLIKTNTVNKVIPSQNETGVTDTITFFETCVIQNIELSLSVAHPHSGNIEAVLTAPSGTSVVVHPTNQNTDISHILEVVDNDVLSDFHQQPLKGDWTLNVRDHGEADEGYLQSWSLRIQFSNGGKSEIFIPEGQGEKLISRQVCDVEGKIKDLSASVDIEHSFIGDLEIVLKAPGGAVTLHQRSGGGENNLQKTWNREQLQPLIGTDAKGIWTLEVLDHTVRDKGRIKSWNIDLSV